MSTSLPAWMWGDPSVVAERLERAELGCSLCKSNAVMVIASICGDQRNTRQSGYPHIGHRCRWFSERTEKGSA